MRLSLPSRSHSQTLTIHIRGSLNLNKRCSPGICWRQSVPLGTFWDICIWPLGASPAGRRDLIAPAVPSASFGGASELRPHLVFDFVGIRQRFVGVLVGMQRRHKLVVVDVAVSVPVEYVRHGAHLQTAGGEFWGGRVGVRSESRLADPRCSAPSGSEGLTGGQDAFDELLPGHLSVLVLVNAAEEVHDARLLMVHPAHVTLPPHVKVKVGELLQLRTMINVNVYGTKGTESSIGSVSEPDQPSRMLHWLVSGLPVVPPTSKCRYGARGFSHQAPYQQRVEQQTPSWCSRADLKPCFLPKPVAGTVQALLGEIFAVGGGD